MSHHESEAKGTSARMADRMLFFSDAVFAIVLTLLALELRAPHYEANSDLWLALLGMGNKIFAFAMSFALVGLWWTVHMRLTRRLVSFDWLTAVFNLVALAGITVLPFATSVFGERPASLDALQFYWWVSAAVGASMTLLFIVSARDHGRLMGGISAREYWFRITQSVAPVIAFAAGIYFCSIGQAWGARMAAFFMFPIMWLGRALLGPRAAKT